MQRAKFVQIYASSFLLKEIKLEAGGLEGEGISISHLNSAFLCGIVTLYERRGIYGGFCHQRKINPSKSWDFFSLSITYMCRYLKTVTCTFLVRILKPLVFGSSPWLRPLLVIFEHHHHKMQPHQEVIVSRAIAITAVIMRSLGCQGALPQADWCAQCRSSWVEPLGRSNPKNHPREISYVGIQAR